MDFSELLNPRPDSQQGKGGIFDLQKVPEQYRAFLEKHRRNNLPGFCAGMTERMKQEFPELLRVRGYVVFEHHWWCETPEGIIVDPTYTQFAPGVTYKAYDESQPEPIGQCFECGRLLYTEGPYGINDGDGLCEDCTQYFHEVKKRDRVYYNEKQFTYKAAQVYEVAVNEATQKQRSR